VADILPIRGFVTPALDAAWMVGDSVIAGLHNNARTCDPAPNSRPPALAIVLRRHHVDFDVYVYDFSRAPCKGGLVTWKHRDAVVWEKCPWSGTIVVYIRAPSNFFINGRTFHVATCKPN